LRGAENAIDDLTLDQIAEKRNILGSLEKLDQASAGAEQPGCRFTHCESARGRCFGFRQFFPADDLSHCRHIQAQEHGEQGNLFRGLNDLTLGRNIDRRQEIGPLV
jgi:hypothetical protein